MQNHQDYFSAALTDETVDNVRVMRFNPDSTRDWSIKAYPLESRWRNLVNTIKINTFKTQSDLTFQYHIHVLQRQEAQ